MNQDVLALLADADKVLIGIGEAFERKDSELETEAFKFLEKENPLIAGFERLQYRKEHPDNEVIQAYDALYELVKDKDFFVVTTCVDDRIYESKFPEERITAPCGTWRYLQCSECCTEELLPVTDAMIEAKERVYCPHCGKIAAFNQVSCEKYNEQGYMAGWVDYRNWLQKTINKKLCIIELGVGMKYPTLVRWPFEKIAFCNNKAEFIRVHRYLYQMTEELKGKGMSVEADPIKFLLNNR